MLLHDPFWAPLRVTEAAHALGAKVVAVHHGSAALDAAGLPGPSRPWEALLRAWLRHAYAPVDAIASVVDPEPDCGRVASFPLRLGLHDAFRPQHDVARGDHVLYVGRLAREKGVFRLLEAAARSADPWPLRLIGSGPAEDALRRRARALGIARRVAFRPFVGDRARLARAYAGARCVVMPGEHETFGLVALEAAASGARVVACASAPSAGLLGDGAHTFAPGDTDGLGGGHRRGPRRAPTDAARRGGAVLAPALGPALRRRARRPARARGVRRAGAIAVALHDVEPATFERCALIRDWLDDHGIERVTLLVIPAPDLHPFHDRRPEMVEWLAECAARGDAIAQHGFQHRASAAAPRRSNPAAEFLGLDADETRRAVEAGRRVLRLAGVRPRGFVAPGLRLHRRAARDARDVVRLVGEPVRIHAPGALDPRARADPRHLERRQAPGLARGWSAPAPWLRATCCGSTCIRPTSTIRATSARWRACSSVRSAASATPSPTTTSLSEQAHAVLRANWREGVHRDGTRVRLHLPGDAALPPPVALGLVLSRHRLVPSRRRRARARSCAPCCAAGAPTASSRTRCSGTATRAGAARRCTRPSACAGAATRRRSGRRCCPSRGSAWPPPATTSRASPPRRCTRWRRTCDWLARERDVDGDGLISILLPDESGLDDSPKYDPVYGPHAHHRPGYFRLVARYGRLRVERARHRGRPRRARRGRVGQRRLRPQPARDGAPGRRGGLRAPRRTGRDGAARALPGPGDRALLRPRRARRAAGAGVDLVGAVAAHARRRCPRTSAGAWSRSTCSHPRRYRAPFGIPSVAMDEPSFRPGFDLWRTWRGPAWMNVAWLLSPALRDLGYDEDADRIAAGMADAVGRDGLREYYDPCTGARAGGEGLLVVGAGGRPRVGVTAGDLVDVAGDYAALHATACGRWAGWCGIDRRQRCRVSVMAILRPC